jgi:hypothetical protein
MRVAYYFCIISLAILTSCGESPYEQLGNIQYKRGDSACAGTNKNHWLMDLRAKNAADSTYLNTFILGRKIEIHTPQIDTASDLYKLLSTTCAGDSVELKLDATAFYTSLNGSVPLNLKGEENITVKVWMRDKLSDVEHIAYKKIFEAKAANSYVKENKWNAVYDTAMDVYIERLKKNELARGDFNKVKIKYEISSLNDRPIANSRIGDLFVYDKNDKEVIMGISYLVDRLAVGESGRVLVPSALAYGENGNEKVPGYMPVIIEIEVVEKIE